ncbi:hypothetical protein [Flaviaesturariibacter amylovorans]|uniref:Uncharacterized protein n=1 Tax=Flaviaesturariibacter amylovorans TaxID=1084520 RepID=A0ABP8HQX6_9BACT
MMTLFAFQLLTPAEQLDLLYEAGTYIGKRRVEGRVRILYQLEGFYIEVHYKKYRCIAEKLVCFRSTIPLEPYLEAIDVEHLV